MKAPRLTRNWPLDLLLGPATKKHSSPETRHAAYAKPDNYAPLRQKHVKWPHGPHELWFLFQPKAKGN